MRVDLDTGLDAAVARMIVPAVDRVVAQVREAAAVTAPDGKTWVTAQDERVRPTHADMDGVTIPGNVPYLVGRTEGAGTEPADKPRDPDLSVSNRVNCRCQSIPVPGAVARSLTTDPARAEGPIVKGSVTSSYTRVVESEHDDGWLLKAARDVAATRR